MFIHHPLMLTKDGKIERLHIEHSEEEVKREVEEYNRLEEEFMKKYPDIKFDDYMVVWDLLIRCKNDEEVHALLEEEKKWFNP